MKRLAGSAVALVGMLFLSAGLACAAQGKQASGRPHPIADWLAAHRAGGQGEPIKTTNVRRTLTVGGTSRWYELHVPPQYRKGSPAAVIMVWHGGGGFPAAVAKQSHMDEVSDKEGFLVVYPAGSGIFAEKLLTFNAGICCDYAVKKGIDDVAFARAVIDDLAKDYGVDRRRIYSTGISNGALMSYRLACEAPDLVAAIAPISGTLGVPCEGSGRAVSVIHFHGLADQNCPYNGGKGAHSVAQVDFKSVPDTIAFWVKRDGCPAKPSATKEVGSATETVYGPGRDGAEVALWSIGGGGHTWPGGDWASALEGKIVGPVNRDIFASQLMWEFFARHPKP